MLSFFPSHPSFVIAKPRASSPSVKLGLSSATMLEKPFIVMPKLGVYDFGLHEWRFLFVLAQLTIFKASKQMMTLRHWPDTHYGAIYCSLGLLAASQQSLARPAYSRQANTAIDGATVRVWPVPHTTKEHNFLAWYWCHASLASPGDGCLVRLVEGCQPCLFNLSFPLHEWGTIREVPQ